jgi:hypothetical protein
MQDCYSIFVKIQTPFMFCTTFWQFTVVFATESSWNKSNEEICARVEQ